MMNKIRLQKKNIVILLALLASLLVFLSATNPDRVSLGLLLVPIILLASIVYVFTRTALSFFPRFSSKKKNNAISLVMGFMVASLLVFQSIGQLTIGDVTIVAVLGAVSIFYISRLL